MSDTNAHATQPAPDVAEILWAVKAVYEQLESDEYLLAAQVVKETADALARVAAERDNARKAFEFINNSHASMGGDLSHAILERDTALLARDEARERAERAEAELARLGPEERQYREIEGLQLWQSCGERLAQRKRDSGIDVRTIRVVQEENQ